MELTKKLELILTENFFVQTVIDGYKKQLRTHQLFNPNEWMQFGATVPLSAILEDGIDIEDIADFATDYIEEKQNGNQEGILVPDTVIDFDTDNQNLNVTVGLAFEDMLSILIHYHLLDGVQREVNKYLEFDHRYYLVWPYEKETEGVGPIEFEDLSMHGTCNLFAECASKITGGNAMFVYHDDDQRNDLIHAFAFDPVSNRYFDAQANTLTGDFLDYQLENLIRDMFDEDGAFASIELPLDEVVDINTYGSTYGVNTRDVVVFDQYQEWAEKQTKKILAELRK